MRTIPKTLAIAIGAGVLLVLLAATAYAQNAPGSTVGTEQMAGQVTSVNPLAIDGTPIRTDNRTVTHGNVQAGASADAYVVRTKDGALVARRIDVPGKNKVANGHPDCDEGQIQMKGNSGNALFKGTVTNMNPLTICGQRILVDDKTLTMGKLQTGVRADVQAVRQADGSFLARKITVLQGTTAANANQCVDGRVRVQGDVNNVQFQGRISSANPLVIGGWPVSTDGQTVTVGTPAVGQGAKVQAVRNSDGSMLARNIQIVDASETAGWPDCSANPAPANNPGKGNGNGNGNNGKGNGNGNGNDDKGG